MREMRQWFCNFIALVVLVLGVCVFDTGAEPAFAYSKTELSSAHCSEAAYEKSDPRQNTDAICPTGFISSSQIAAQITNGRRVLRPLLYFFFAAVCALQITGFYETGRVTEFTGLVGRFVVLDFIHDADGKKKIAFFDSQPVWTAMGHGLLCVHKIWVSSMRERSYFV